MMSLTLVGHSWDFKWIGKCSSQYLAFYSLSWIQM